jgi:hypothetical protein
MRRSISRASLNVEEVEARRLLSGVTPVLTSPTYDTVVADVRRVMANLERTHDAPRAADRLRSLSAAIPLGHRQLAPVWSRDLASYNPAVTGSGRATEQRLLADLEQDVAAGVAAGAFRVTGKDAAAFPRFGSGAPLSSLDSVRVANKTTLTLAVTVTLNNTGRSIPMTIQGNGAVALFNFGTATGNFMTIQIRNANGASPPPYTTGLNRPISGYNGALFSVSLFAGRFSVGS